MACRLFRRRRCFPHPDLGLSFTPYSSGFLRQFLTRAFRRESQIVGDNVVDGGLSSRDQRCSCRVRMDLA